MATTTLSPQLKLRGIFFSDDSPENPTTTTPGDIFSNITSAITSFFDYLINLFNQKLPPETRDEQIHRFLDGATPYLIVAGVLITCLCCWCYIFPCVSCIVVGLFNVVCSVFGCVFACVRCVVVATFNGVCSVLRCVGSCLCCGVRSSRKMMKAPGKPSLKIPRGAFEGNPRGYFRSLCGMEVDEIQSLQVSKFQRVSSNGSTTSTDNSSNPQKLASNRGNFELQNHVDVVVGGVGGGGGGGVRLCGWPSSRIVRVSRASGGKDRHSKVLTSKGLRDRRVRLSVGTAIQFYDLQDRLGYDQPSKAVEWLLKAAASSIDELPSLDPPFSGGISDRKVTGDGNDNVCSQAKSPACSSTSETSKGSGLSLSRSENRIKARERAREMASKKEKEKEIDSTRVSVLNQVNHMPENSTFTDLLTGGINTTTTTTNTNDYLFTRTLQPSPNLIQIPQFHNHHHHQQPPQHHHFSFLQDTFAPATGGGDNYSLNFAMTASPTGAVALGGFSRGTLQSNLQSSLLPHHHHHHLQRFQSSSIDVPTSSNLPFFIVPNATVDHYPAAGGYHLSYGGDGGGRRSDHQKEKSKN